jgi:starch synthase
VKILLISSEVAPFAKTGGLADVAGSLPKALRASGHDVRIVLPAYRTIEDKVAAGRDDIRVSPLLLQVPVGRTLQQAGVFEAVLPGSDVPVSFIAERSMFGRPNFYGYDDDAFRFAFFSRAALDLEIAAKGWRPDVVHAHDWHAAGAIAWLATAGNADPRYRAMPTLLTIHNLMHQGRAPGMLLDYLGIPDATRLAEEGGGVNTLARGIFHATMINTVSPTYAREIMTSEGGCGLEGLLRHRAYDVHGVLNGIDTDLWNPRNDRHLAARFGVDSIDARARNKKALQHALGLPERTDVPLLAMITRLDAQKGLDLAEPVLHHLLDGSAGEAQFVVIGTGAEPYEQMFRQMAERHRDKMRAVLAYAADLAPLVYGGSDMFLMPSRFEPCGLGQMIAMRYGSVPIVRATGGLADTVHDWETGFTFSEFDAGAFWQAVSRALERYRGDPAGWRGMQQTAMRRDLSWDQSAHRYAELYSWAQARVRGW